METSSVKVSNESRLTGAFKYLSQLTELTQLRLVDITIDDCSQSLPQTLESLITLESLTIDNLKIETSGPSLLLLKLFNFLLKLIFFSKEWMFWTTSVLY